MRFPLDQHCSPQPAPASQAGQPLAGDREADICYRALAQLACSSMRRKITALEEVNPERRKRAHIHQLEALGGKVTLEPAA
ncbi:MAG TPA: hypothetical protein VIK57_25145 [Streptosporangiaceae bacterium]